jgi:signal peptidase I
MVFRYPEDPSLDYIKRVVGLPGDRVVYQNKRLTINGQPVATTRVEDYLHPERLYYSRQYTEQIDAAEYRTLNDADAPPYVRGAGAVPESRGLFLQCRA